MEAIASSFEHLGDVVDAFGYGVGDAGFEVGEDAVLLAQQAPGEFLEGGELALAAALGPSLEERLGFFTVFTGVELGEVLLEEVGLVQVPVPVDDRVQRLSLRAGELGTILQPQPPRAFDELRVLFLQCPILFVPPHLVDGPAQIPEDVELVEDQRGVLQMPSYALMVRVPQVRTHRLHGLFPLFAPLTSSKAIERDIPSVSQLFNNPHLCRMNPLFNRELNF